MARHYAAATSLNTVDWNFCEGILLRMFTIAEDFNVYTVIIAVINFHKNPSVKCSGVFANIFLSIQSIGYIVSVLADLADYQEFRSKIRPTSYHYTTTPLSMSNGEMDESLHFLPYIENVNKNFLTT